MTDAEKLAEMEAELRRLAAQLTQQREEMTALHLRIKAMQGVDAVPNGPLPSPKPSLLQHSSFESLIGLRLIHLVGIVVLVIGLSLGVKYAIDRNLISEELRIGLAYAAAATLLILSLRLRKRYAGFSAILFSGAMASIYFTTYGAFVYYGFLSYPLAFAIIVALTVYTSYEAWRYNRQEIALLGLVGAYGIPFLISPNTGHTEMLFLYVGIINCGVVALSAINRWTTMGRSAQAISWLLFWGWATFPASAASLQRYGLIFLCLFFVQFALSMLLPKLMRRESFTTNAVFQLLTNNMAAYVAALLLYTSTQYSDKTVAVISIVFSIIAVVQAIAFRLWKEAYATLLHGCYALLLFLLFIGFWWEGITVTLLWLLVAVVVFVAGVRLKTTALRIAAIGLMALTLAKLVLFDSLTFTTLQKVIAYLVLGVLLLLVSFFYQRKKAALEE